MGNMGKLLKRPVAYVFVPLLLLVAATAADKQPCAESEGQKEGADSGSGDGKYERHWYFLQGASNYHPKLGESEAQINREINNTLGIIPGWKRPITFEDWRDDWRLWDLTLGVGRDITPKTSWLALGGGAKGTIKNKETYFPLGTDIRFTRATVFFTIEGYYYPWGKPPLGNHALGDKRRVWSRLRDARPYGALGLGYTFVRAEGDVRLKLPLVGRVFRKKESDDHHMHQVSPRVGIEVPVGKKNTATTGVSYSFPGPDHKNEYGGPTLFVGIKHRF